MSIVSELINSRKLEGGSIKPVIPVIPNDYSYPITTLVGQKVDVSIQDQHTTPIDFYFLQINGVPTTLDGAITTVNPTTFVYTFDVTDATNFAVGNYAGIFQDAEAERFFFAEILNVAGTTITVDTPIDFNYDDGVTVASFDRNINVNGAVTPQIFQVEVGPSSISEVDLNRQLWQMKTDTAVQLDEFGDLTRLTNGCVLRIVRADGTINNIWNIKDNAQMSLHSYDVTFYTALGQGQDGLSCRMTYNGQDKRGVTIRLAPGDKLQFVVQDDLTDLDEFFLMMHGHFVTSD